MDFHTLIPGLGKPVFFYYLMTGGPECNEGFKGRRFSLRHLSQVFSFDKCVHHSLPNITYDVERKQ